VDDVVRSTVLVEIHGQPFSPWQELDAWSRDAAAMSVFLGKVRGTALDGGDLEALEVEHYAGLCERCIESSARRLLIEHGASAAMVLHRVGRLSPGDLIVLVAVQADRRGSAQRCSAALLEALKHDAPFWKREWRNGQGVWLEGNTPL
jgi:molybdopterin synthase catalytic subunit